MGGLGNAGEDTTTGVRAAGLMGGPIRDWQLAGREDEMVKRFVWMWVVLALSTQLGWSQTTATISGTVRDTSGAVIPGTSVTVRNVDTGTTRTAMTDAQGRFQFPNLGSGNWEVQAEKEGVEQ